MKIIKASCEVSEEDAFDNGIVRKVLLPGEINGLETSYVEISEGNVVEYQSDDKMLRIFLFTNGTGNISSDNMNIPIHEIAIFIPDMQQKYTVSGGAENLGYLEIAMYLAPHELKALSSSQSDWPYFVPYAECKKYNESIKSEKTISRMILSEDVVPRLCIGSVETCGPDEVASHTHPMLEQLFFGLSGNDIVVTADAAESRFLGNDLLHIPLGSMHGVRVEEGKDLHYIWIDLFHSQEDMDYISNSHHIINE